MKKIWPIFPKCWSCIQYRTRNQDQIRFWQYHCRQSPPPVLLKRRPTMSSGPGTNSTWCALILTSTFSELLSHLVKTTHLHHGFSRINPWSTAPTFDPESEVREGTWLGVVMCPDVQLVRWSRPIALVCSIWIITSSSLPRSRNVACSQRLTSWLQLEFFVV